MLKDTIRISELALHLPSGAGPSSFGLVPPPACPAVVSLEIQVQDKVIPSCTADDTFGGLGPNYSAISKAIIAHVGSQEWRSPEALLRGIVTVPLDLDVVELVRATLQLPKASLVARSITYSAMFSPTCRNGEQWRCTINDIHVKAVVGLHPHERARRQALELDVGIQGHEEEYQPRRLAEHVHDVSRAPECF
jgi:dihydroneopterin aldolase/2-amino-4-hydroxy-6-hydroxymethyldihydropteridine diphosphokinase/dihydropteroate synthase